MKSQNEGHKILIAAIFVSYPASKTSTINGAGPIKIKFLKEMYLVD